jgi:hypothetical protein
VGRGSRRVAGGPREIGSLRRLLGGPCARVLGLIDGIFASEDKSQAELHKFKDRAELGGADAAMWWAEVSGKLNGECAALTSRIEDAVEAVPRLEREIEAAKAVYTSSGNSDDETRLRRLERDLIHVRQERSHLSERLRRSEEDRLATYRRARAAALTFREHYESVMRSYSAANRKSVHTESVPEIRLPEELENGPEARVRAPRLITAPPAPEARSGSDAAQAS